MQCDLPAQNPYGREGGPHAEQTHGSALLTVIEAVRKMNQTSMEFQRTQNRTDSLKLGCFEYLKGEKRKNHKQRNGQLPETSGGQPYSSMHLKRIL